MQFACIRQCVLLRHGSLSEASLSVWPESRRWLVPQTQRVSNPSSGLAATDLRNMRLSLTCRTVLHVAREFIANGRCYRCCAGVKMNIDQMQQVCWLVVANLTSSPHPLRSAFGRVSRHSLLCVVLFAFVFQHFEPVSFFIS